MTEPITGKPDLASFNIAEDFKPIPLVPQGTYIGNITRVSFQEDFTRLNVSVTLVENSGTMTDNETPIDGTEHTYMVFIPQEKDKHEMTQSGKQTKFQYKVNTMRSFFQELKAPDINTMDDIEKAIAEGRWLGTRVSVEVQIEMYQGNTLNKIRRMSVI